MDADRTKRLQAVLQWSLRQQEEEGERIQGPRGAQIDPERHRWLKEALEAFSSQPSETDLLKAALAVLKAHSSPSAGDSIVLSDSQLKNLEEAFEQVKYYVEDLDHANDLIPLEGIEAITQYLNSDNTILTRLGCELIAIASQNNPPCQKAFLPALTKLLELVKDDKSTEDVKIQTVRAISSLSRGYEPGLRQLLVQGGFCVIVDCLNSGIRKVTIKALFMISTFYTSEMSPEVQGILNDKIGNILSSLVNLLRDCDDSDLLEHVLSLLSTLLHNRLAEVKKQHAIVVILKEVLVAKQSSLSPMDHKDELEKIKGLIQRLCEN